MSINSIDFIERLYQLTKLDKINKPKVINQKIKS